MSKKSTASSKPRQTKILLDTNAYLRLAKSLHPLLGQTFGEENYALYIHERLQFELNRSERLHSKFNFLFEDEFKINREKIIACSRSQKKEIDITYDFIWNFQKGKGNKLSLEDIYCVATAEVLKLVLVSDEKPIVEVCNAFDVEVINSINLLKLMYDCKYINIEKIMEIRNFLYYINDWQSNFNEDMKKYFNIDP